MGVPVTPPTGQGAPPSHSNDALTMRHALCQTTRKFLVTESMMQDKEMGCCDGVDVLLVLRVEVWDKNARMRDKVRRSHYCTATH